METRRPIEAAEIPYLEALGARLRELRKSVGLTQPDVVDLAELSVGGIGRIETGSRRTRRSTLGRIAVALTEADPSLGKPDAFADSLAMLAGRALAPESPYPDRIARRRERRTRRRRQATVAQVEAHKRAEINKLLREMKRLYPLPAEYANYGGYS